MPIIVPKESINSTSADLEKDVQHGERASSNRSDDKKHGTTSPQKIVRSPKETKNVEVNAINEPDPEGVLAKVLSRTTSHISIDPGPPPDGGLAAWCQVVMVHLIVFNTWGYVTSFGVFQTYYVTTLGHSPSDISWVRKAFPR